MMGADVEKEGRHNPGSQEASPRSNEGPDSRVACWHRDLQRQLGLLAPYLEAGRLVTFQQITSEEKAFFEELVETVRIPEGVCAVFIPPSIVQTAMWPGSGGASSEGATGLYCIAPDAGAVAAQRCGAPDTIVNALFAFPPLSPGIDVYQEGHLLAGCTYQDHAQCAQALSDILQTYLAGSPK